MDRFCTFLRSILLSLFAIVLKFPKQKTLSAENTFSLPHGILWISSTVDCCSTCQTSAFSGKRWECVRTMNSSSAGVHCVAWAEREPRGAVGQLLCWKHTDAGVFAEYIWSIHRTYLETCYTTPALPPQLLCEERAQGRSMSRVVL